jgi:hypothetical protein
VNVHVIEVVSPWIVPSGSTPLVVTSELTGKEIAIFKYVVAPEFSAPLCKVSVAGVDKEATDLDAKIVVSVAHTPLLGYGSEHCLTSTCRPLVPSVTNNPDPAAPRVIADEFNVPGLERIT